ncbi:bifunctional diguanylate cyclase/phosphodiesterase [Devosia sp. 67-54]|uniref:putative bifunctional diguanylate cyclase/phosphodiesterase n=1 Tax=Devosia sp. 67-54 TaxID=1895754 RepID=UPI001ACA33C6|nr:bifunctional diguanylate cyclase/phosphodiesterase [Devosia sp. 67-54]MBN9303957.1 GGDEF domain-containing protein [Devosia sp.]
MASAIGAGWRTLRGRASAATLARVVSDNFAGMVVVESGGVIVAASRIASDLLNGGRPLDGHGIRQALPPDMRHAIEQVLAGAVASTELALAVIRRGEGEDDRLVLQYAVTASEVDSGRIACLNFWDVTERRRAEERLSFLASHDPLTGALSRTGLCAAINQRFETERGRGEGLAVLAIDLARFKPVNDALGHAHGDMLLKQVVGRLRATGAAYVARLGGHGFAVAHPGLDGGEAIQFCELIQDRLTLPYQLGPHRAIIGAEVGISHSGVSGFDPDRLLSHADMALSIAREGAGRGHASFSPEMDAGLRARQELETAMQQAMERGEISLMFQPQASLDDGTVIGVEALMRWVHPELGSVSPERFIPVAEETGKIVELGRWILEAACREVAGWPGHLKLSVNVSPIQFELVDVVGEVKEALTRSGLPAHRLDVEITEGIFMSNARAVTDALQRLRNLGVGIALDDFGTGYSSLSYIGRLPIDKIKIDQSFVKRLPGDQQAGVIVRAVMMLSEALDKIVIAEGIETADQAWMLKMMGCKVGQGYHFGRPKTAAEMRAMLAEKSATDRIAG